MCGSNVVWYGILLQEVCKGKGGGGVKLYTAGSTIANREACQRLGVGLLIVDHWRDPTKYPYFAIDNGCYSAWKQGKKWNPGPFLNNLHKCVELGLTPDFAVIPDIVAGGERSAK